MNLFSDNFDSTLVVRSSLIISPIKVIFRTSPIHAATSNNRLLLQDSNHKLLSVIPSFLLSQFDRDAVMWLNAYKASIHHVYFGTDRANVTSATPASAEHKDRIIDNGNVHYLTESLLKGSTYYWRVDAVITAATIHKGDVWTFQTE